MSNKIVIKKEITISEAKQMLERLENPSPFQVRTLDYAKKFAKIESSKAVELVDKLVAEFEIERKDAIEVVDAMPYDLNELRVFFSTGRKRLIVTAKLEKMLKILEEYR